MSTLNSSGGNRKPGIFIDKNKRAGSPQIAIRFGLDTFKLLKRQAAKDDKPISFIVRQIVGEYLAR